MAGCVVAADPARLKFAGTWRMDEARSESTHQDVPAGPSTVVIGIVENTLTVETTRDKFHEVLTFNLNGTDTTSTGDGGASVTGKAHWEGAKLVVETLRNIQDSTVTTRYVHTLSANGRDLTIDKTLTVQHGYMGRSAPTMGHGKDVFVRVE